MKCRQFQLNQHKLSTLYFRKSQQIRGGHKVGPSFFECQELVDFVLKHAK